MSPPAQDSERRQLERLLAVTRRLAAPFELVPMLEQVIEAGTSILDAERGSVFLYDADRDELFTTAATGLKGLRVPADRGIVGECARTREIINVPDCYADPRFNPDADRKSGFRSRCLLSLPLVGHDDSLVGVLQILNKKQGVFDRADERVAAALAAQCAVALQRVRMTDELLVKERQDRELAVARDIQKRVLPGAMPEVAGHDVAGISRPAEETGGDIFDLVPMDGGGLLMLLGDATGHGVGPAISVTQVRAMLRMAVRLRADIDTVFVEINNQLVDDLADNRFVTAFLGRLDPETHRVHYHSAGQGPLMHFHAQTGEVTWFGASAPPLGMVPQTIRKQPSIDLQEGDILGLMTDGVFEAEDAAGEPFDRERVESIVRAGHAASMADLAARLMGEVNRFEAPPQADDITIVLLRRKPGDPT